jgi:hypothetical protein
MNPGVTSVMDFKFPTLASFRIDLHRTPQDGYQRPGLCPKPCPAPQLFASKRLHCASVSIGASTWCTPLQYRSNTLSCQHPHLHRCPVRTTFVQYGRNHKILHRIGPCGSMCLGKVQPCRGQHDSIFCDEPFA